MIPTQIINDHLEGIEELPSYKRTIETRNELIWQSIASTTLREAAEQWLSTIKNPCTQISYRTAMNELHNRGFIDMSWSLQGFSLISANSIIDRIKTEKIFIFDKFGHATTQQWSERTREARIACLLSFSRYLSRKTDGIIGRGVASRDGIEKTFSSKPRHVKTKVLNRAQLFRFFEELDKINARDAMIARLCLHGGKRINEVLSLTTEQIDVDKRRITFKQSKTRYTDDVTIISFEHAAARHLFDRLMAYIWQKIGIVFTTASGKKIQKNQVDRNFAKAGLRAGVSFRVSPHNLRATAVTLWKEDGFSDSHIMKATGHASAEMVHRYDKTDIADNVTKQSCLF